MVLMAKVNTYSQLEALLREARTEALEKASKQAADYVKDEVIAKEVYTRVNPTFYERTYDLQNSVVDRPVEGGGAGTATVKINHDTSMIGYSPENFQHGNEYYGSATESIAEIVHDGLSGNMFGFGAWQVARPYMDNAAMDLDGGGKFRKFMMDELRGMGFTVK